MSSKMSYLKLDSKSESVWRHRSILIKAGRSPRRAIVLLSGAGLLLNDHSRKKDAAPN